MERLPGLPPSGRCGTSSPELQSLYRQIQAELANPLAASAAPYLQPSFALLHADLKPQNVLFTRRSPDPKSNPNSPVSPPPFLTRVIDFENSFAAPLYYLYEYPVLIQDVSWSPERYATDA
ncbi:hypothetical protein N657DRAFT_639744 [Parathielavia appendiculata]|uniref:Protein kinase domain-containing protein n=1 Tax=Parathielavia appendiculata TaxID=2587402 RepID=A0AAN6UA16_9PEZI|nr:hypothetical protein N657DRAFT_639744 [Parathielavia appendiculata]